MTISWRQAVGGSVALIVLGALVSFLEKPGVGESPHIAKAARETRATAAPAERRLQPIGDDDEDGIPNWEEALRHTNPYNPDSDGDGMRDGDELEAGRDPLKKGPDDVVSRPFPLPTSPPAGTVVQIRIPIDQGVAAAEVAPEQTPPERTSRTETAASAASSELRAFGNALGAALAPVTDKGFTQNEQVLIAQAIPSRDGRVLPSLAPLAESYERVARDLATVSAPPDRAALLRNLTESYAYLGRAVRELSRGDAELKVLSERWSEYSASVIAVGKAANDIIGLFATHAVTFGANDPGRIFVFSGM